jgi:uncharacterized protein
MTPEFGSYAVRCWVVSVCNTLCHGRGRCHRGAALSICRASPNMPPMDQVAPRPTKRCPICGKPALQRFRPFCSKRCGDIDLNRWLKGSYAVPVIEEDSSARGEREEEAS